MEGMSESGGCRGGTVGLIVENESGLMTTISQFHQCIVGT